MVLGRISVFQENSRRIYVAKVNGDSLAISKVSLLNQFRKQVFPALSYCLAWSAWSALDFFRNKIDLAVEDIEKYSLHCCHLSLGFIAGGKDDVWILVPIWRVQKKQRNATNISEIESLCPDCSSV